MQNEHKTAKKINQNFLKFHIYKKNPRKPIFRRTWYLSSPAENHFWPTNIFLLPDLKQPQNLSYGAHKKIILIEPQKWLMLLNTHGHFWTIQDDPGQSWMDATLKDTSLWTFVVSLQFQCSLCDFLLLLAPTTQIFNLSCMLHPYAESCKTCKKACRSVQ